MYVHKLGMGGGVWFVMYAHLFAFRFNFIDVHVMQIYFEEKVTFFINVYGNAAATYFLMWNSKKGRGGGSNFFDVKTYHLFALQ